ncbi:MAG: S41 family peptidase [Ignavibacteriales bacterium CG_4_9_14_3_um_filter_30_11]|nr:MAG: S41 family peptidase [Ignavibacteriales bacterium CG_4_9_14_3_um_filter_30_11]
MKIKKIKIVISSVLLLVFVSGFAFVTDKYFEISKNIDLFSRVYKEVSFNYVEDIDPALFMRAGIYGMLNSLDPYTTFLDENKKEDYDLLTTGKYGGIGVSIGLRGDKVTITDVFDGYSSQRQGIRVGDVLIEAANISITPDNIDQMSSLVKGKPGTTVNIKILRNEEKDTLSFNIVREEVIVKSLLYAGFYPLNSNNVYLKLNNFSRSASDEIRTALKKLQKTKKIKSILLDLRNNPGGLLDVAVNLSDDLLPKGNLIVSTLAREKTDEKKYYSLHDPLIENAKIVVLINGNSASASEIVTGALQDHDKAVIVGTKSFGKGLVQTIIPLSYNTSVKITTAKYYTPSGRSIQRIDYTKDNKVIAVPDSIIKSSYKTDNNRTVYSGGGINPDTTVEFDEISEVTRDILAKGFFFTFADKYYYSNKNLNFNKLNDDQLLIEFKNYLVEQKFTFKSKNLNELNDLTASFKKMAGYKNVISKLNNLKTEIEEIQKSEIDNNKIDILAQLKSELASRYLGTEARNEELLKNDNQFQFAFELTKNNDLYNKLLHNK